MITVSAKEFSALKHVARVRRSGNSKILLACLNLKVGEAIGFNKKEWKRTQANPDSTIRNCVSPMKVQICRTNLGYAVMRIK